jgi:hypothetical protein
MSNKINFASVPFQNIITHISIIYKTPATPQIRVVSAIYVHKIAYRERGAKLETNAVESATKNVKDCFVFYVYSISIVYSLD